MMLLSFLCFSLLFWVKITDQSHFLVFLCALRVPGPVRDYSCKTSSNKFPAYVNAKCLLILLLLSGDIALNPGPINFGFVNCHSIRNKGPLIGITIVSNNLDILALAETHIQISDTNGLLKSVTPPDFQLTHKPRTTSHSGGVGFLTRKDLPSKTVDEPTHSTFENIIISIVTHSKSFAVACVYLTPGSCSSASLDDFLFFCAFLSSLTSSFIICGDFNVLVETDSIYQRIFLNLLDTSNVAQNVNQSTHLHGHTLDLILSPSDSSFVSNVTVGNLVSDHALVKCYLDFACAALPTVHSISYRRYHKINMQSFCEDLANTSFITSPASMAIDLYYQYISDLGGVLGRHAPLIC